MQRLTELEYERQRYIEEKRKIQAAWEIAQCKRRELVIKINPIAPLQMSPSITAGVGISLEYEYNDTYGAEGGYLMSDITWKAFKDDKYVSELIRVYFIDIKMFKKKHYDSIKAADALWRLTHEQLHTTAFNPAVIMDRLIVAFDFPPALSDAYSYHSYKFLKNYIKEWMKEWKLMEGGTNWSSKEPIENLWIYFKAWFLNYRLAPVLCARAGLVDAEYPFRKESAGDGGADKDIDSGWGSIEYALRTLHEYHCDKKDGDKKDGGQENKLKLPVGNNEFKEKDDDTGGDNDESSVKEKSNLKANDASNDEYNYEEYSYDEYGYNEYSYDELKEMIAAAKRAGPTYYELTMEYEYSGDEGVDAHDQMTKIKKINK